MTTTKAAIWARVSTSDQHTGNQLDHLRKIAAAKGLEIAAEFVTEDSAWSRIPVRSARAMMRMS